MWSEKPNSGRSPVSHIQTRDKELAICHVWTQEQRRLCAPAQMSRPRARFFPAGHTCLDLSAKIVPLFLPLSFFWFPGPRVCEFLATHNPPQSSLVPVLAFRFKCVHGCRPIADIPTCDKQVCRLRAAFRLKSRVQLAHLHAGKG